MVWWGQEAAARRASLCGRGLTRIDPVTRILVMNRILAVDRISAMTVMSVMTLILNLWWLLSW